MSGPIRRAAAWFRALFANPEDTEEDLRRKRLLPLVFAVWLTYFYHVPMSLGNWNSLMWNVLKFFWFLGILVYVRVTRVFPRWLCEGSIVCLFLQSALIADLATYGEKEYWTLSVLMMDCLLLARAGQRVTMASFCIMFIYIVILTIEQVYDVWLFRLMEDAGMGERPTPVGAENGNALMINRMTVFGFDFLLTRRFSYRLFDQQEQMSASIEAAELIASALVRFDTNKAGDIIAQSAMPEGLSHAFQALLVNLRQYRPYLPHSVLPECCEMTEEENTDDRPMSPFTVTESATEVSSLTSLSTTSAHGVVLQRRTVTLLAANLRHFLSSSSTPEALMLQLTDFLDQSVKCVRDNHGLLDRFHGDHIVFSFNAAKPLPYGHGPGALRAALDIRSTEFVTRQYKGMASPGSPVVSIGVTTGAAICGMAGSEGSAKGFNVVGSVACRVNQLERLAAARDCSILTCNRLNRDAMTLAHCRIVDSVKFPKDTHPTLVWSVEDVKVLEADEWMYQLEKSVKEDKFAEYNAAKRAWIQGEARTWGSTAGAGVEKMWEELQVQAEAGHRHFELRDCSLTAVAVELPLEDA